MINAKLKSYEKTKVGANYLFETDVQSLASYIQDFFNSEGYALKEGISEKGSYLKGSAGMRVLLGGFANRFKFNVEINDQDGMAYLILSRGMSGASAGLIGYTKNENEINRIREKINKESLH